MQAARRAIQCCVSALSVRELAGGKPYPQLQPYVPTECGIIHGYTSHRPNNSYPLTYCYLCHWNFKTDILLPENRIFSVTFCVSCDHLP